MKANIRDFLKVYWPLGLIALLGLVVTLLMMDPAPPKSIRFAAGTPGGAYHAYAMRYANILGEAGVEVELVPTNGSVEHLRLLQDGEVDVALVQGGLARASDAEALRSLGGMFEEPFWVFVRADFNARSFGDLRNARMAIGPLGSGTRQLAKDIQFEFAGNWPESLQSPLSGMAAVTALSNGEIDAAVFAASVEAPYVQTLLRMDGVTLLRFPQAAAIALRREALASTVLLRGVVDIGAEVPVTDVPLVAPVAQLVIRKDIHPAIEAVLISAASDIHGEGSLLSRAGTFPDADATDLPVTGQAVRYYRDGPSFLRRYFSFGVANFLERSWVLAIPLLTLLFPLVRMAPPIYRWRVRRKIYVWYDDLQELETRGRQAETDAQRQTVAGELENLQIEIGKLDVPLSYTDDLYRLRGHVEFVKTLIIQQRPEPP